MFWHWPAPESLLQVYWLFFYVGIEFDAASQGEGSGVEA